MKKIERDELFGHISDFLKAKGIELQEGTYTKTIQKGCQVLADTINLSQQAMQRAKTEVEEKLEQMRQAIHEGTAPRPKPPVTPGPGDIPAAPQQKPPKIKPTRKASAGALRPKPRRPKK